MGDEERRLSVTEVRKTIASSLGTAFGFVTGLVWSQVVLGGFAVANITLTAGTDMGEWAVFTVTALVVTVVMVILIIFVSRWGSKGATGIKG